MHGHAERAAESAPFAARGLSHNAQTSATIRPMISQASAGAQGENNSPPVTVNAMDTYRKRQGRGDTKCETDSMPEKCGLSVALLCTMAASGVAICATCADAPVATIAS